MSLSSFLGIADNVADLVGEFVEDKDKANEINGKIAALKEQAYITELQTQTVPLIDAIHKMGRQILSLLNLVIPAVLLYLKPEIDPLALAAIVTPSGVYNYVKGKGR